MQNSINEMMTKVLQSFSSNDLDTSEVVLRKVLKLSPNYFEALHIMGVIKGIKNQHQSALEHFKKALKIEPDNGYLNFNIAKAFSELGQDEMALKYHLKSIKIEPSIAERHLSYGKSLTNLKKYSDAIIAFKKAIELKPDYAESYYNMGIVLQELSYLNEALTYYEKSIDLKSDFAKAYVNRGVVLRQLKRLEESIASYNRALAIKHDSAEAYNNRGNSLRDLNWLEESLASFDKAIALDPKYADAYINRGNVLKDLKRLEEALASYEMAIAIDPDCSEAYWNKSYTLLLKGEFNLGWELHEWRWKEVNSAKYKRDFPQPLWLGAENISGKTILLHAEQGFGDTIQFCRYASLVKARGARVVMEVQQPLLALLESMDCIDLILEKGKPLPEFDYHCPLLSLPLAFRTELTSIPNSNSYLFANSQKSKEWMIRLGEKSKPRIGLAWSGSTIHKNDHNRSLTFDELLPFLPKGYEYISLQKEIRCVDTDTLTASGFKYFGEELNDFSDTAAICALMDIVVSVDTSVAHLAAAMGKKTLILLPFAPDWRWLLDREDSPWYESVKLIRQPNASNWQGALKVLRFTLETELNQTNNL